MRAPHIAALALAALSIASPLHTAAVDLVPGVTVGVERNGDGYVVVATLIAPGVPATAWAVLTDFDHMADFMPTLTSSRVLQRQDNRVLVQQRGKMELGTFRMPFESDRMIDMKPPGTIYSKQLRGNMQRVDSTTTFTELPNGTRVDYRVEIVPKLWMPESVAGPMLHDATERQFNAVLREIQRRLNP
jgi:ribosome-associated toxin RatA of RatAB toxin-antitoxin module